MYRSMEYLLPPVTVQDIVPPRRKKHEHTPDNRRGKCPMIVPVFFSKCLEVRQEVLYFSILSYNQGKGQGGVRLYCKVQTAGPLALHTTSGYRISRHFVFFYSHGMDQSTLNVVRLIHSSTSPAAASHIFLCTCQPRMQQSPPNSSTLDLSPFGRVKSLAHP